jgi:hypothetical protein
MAVLCVVGSLLCPRKVRMPVLRTESQIKLAQKHVVRTLTAHCQFTAQQLISPLCHTAPCLSVRHFGPLFVFAHTSLFITHMAFRKILKKPSVSFIMLVRLLVPLVVVSVHF